jgi:5'-deoxynucleotidase YfbR-like HD superfamily hydrolase
MNTSASSLVSQWLEILSACRVGSLDLVKRLAKTPREGKARRINHFRLALPKRSVLDHITSLAYYADTLRRLGVGPTNIPRIAECIVFHDLSEALAGDMPDFTNDELYPYFSPEHKTIAEKRANALIAKSLPARFRFRFTGALAILRCKGCVTWRHFQMLDKTDPIIAVWRYLHIFQRYLDPDTFLRAMDDFFRNPTPKSACTDENIRDFVVFLQNPRNARRYLRTGIAGIREQMPGLLNTLFTGLIEARQDILFTTTPVQLRSKPPCSSPLRHGPSRSSFPRYPVGNRGSRGPSSTGGSRE